MQAIATTRGKDGKFLRPQMTTLDALRDLVWDDLPAPPEEEMPKIDIQMVMFGKPSTDQEGDEDLGVQAASSMLPKPSILVMSIFPSILVMSIFPSSLFSNRAIISSLHEPLR